MCLAILGRIGCVGKLFAIPAYREWFCVGTSCVVSDIVRSGIFATLALPLLGCISIDLRWFKAPDLGEGE
jgi:hypothetical protein